MAAPTASLLGVERSLSGKRWQARAGDERLALALSQRHGLSDLVGRLLAQRGVTLESAADFLEPSLRRALPDPSHLLDMDRAAARLAAAIQASESVAVFGDYDVDGATSSALLARFFRAVGQTLRVYIPDRITEGYGPNAPALQKLQAEGVRLVITVDCGISAHAALQAASDCGLQVVVVDHHAAEAALPPAYAVVNPNRLDETSPHKSLAAVGVTFLLVVALNRALRQAGFYSAERPEPNLLGWLDLVALGTVADVVALGGLNRVLVAQGLKVLAERHNPGLAALTTVARIDKRLTATHLGFYLGPRVNAGGRVGTPDLGVRLLATEDPAEAASLAARLNELNQERQQIEALVLEQALQQVEAAGPPEGLVFACDEGWHPGVIGIVASRLKDRYNLPALVVALDGGIGKGSGRSVPGLDLGRLVLAARAAGLLVNGGGHPMAAGLTVAREKLEELRAFLAAGAAADLARVAWQPALSLDGVLSAAGATADLVAQTERLAPFGMGNPQPRFAFAGLRLASLDTVGENHLRCRLEGPDGRSLRGIAFRALDNELGQGLLAARGRAVHIAGRLELDSWRGGDAVQLLIEDAALP